MGSSFIKSSFVPAFTSENINGETMAAITTIRHITEILITGFHNIFLCRFTNSKFRYSKPFLLQAISSESSICIAFLLSSSLTLFLLNAELNSMGNTKFLVGDTKTILMHSNYKADTIIVDPPRAGLDKSVIEDIKKINPNMLIYLSCDPITLARDLKLLSDLYDVEELIPYDMFPNTHHVETLVKLTKK